MLSGAGSDGHAVSHPSAPGVNPAAVRRAGPFFLAGTGRLAPALGRSSHAHGGRHEICSPVLRRRGGGLRGSIDADVRDCFLAAVRAGLPAEFASIHSTTEGNPVATIVRALPGGAVEMLIDSTQDAFGARVWTRTICRGLVEDQEAGFIGEGCDEAVVIR